MIGKFIGRENQIFDILQKFKDEGLEYILVGGYAVSAFSHRFSADADLVIRNEDLRGFADTLVKNGFVEIQRKELKSPYGGKFVAFQKNEELPVSVDLLAGSLKSRQTGATWSHSYLKDHSTNSNIEGSERSLEAKIPERELLMAIKLHSGRLTDVRDLVALGTDANFEKVRKHVRKGNQKKLSKILRKIGKTIDSEEFEDSFKGVFSEKEVPEESIKAVKDFIQKIIESD